MKPRYLSVVVPAYNEEDSIGDCLDRLTRQLDVIAEIVVVDNNSTDRTRDIVAEYAHRFDEVVMITEPEQGLVFARNTGLDAATGDAIARIDSDTRVPDDWARSITEFLDADDEGRWAAVCGRGEAYDLPYGDAAARLKERINPFARRSASAQGVRDVPVLYGSNMILRRDTWAKIADKVSMRRDVFEDVDTGLCVQEAGGRNAFLPHITVGVSARRMESGLPSFVQYMSCLPRTLVLHRRYTLAAGAALLYLPSVTALHAVRLLVIRAYDKNTGRFAVRNMLRPTEDRVMP
ncbi:glycosyl transferase [Rhodococcoides trifolii]|uniref:4,4'-diaponeurosporenoate glycosyltransferase n=1 Tax=Rhodococcoides trifolii TaxID=908250 RepID=A0A917D8J9_9NOCA|nr:glycosyltransferase family 2 protein [Rhodococcus trifolii]GGG12857.1 glycosyl transferase [Rhodococcus trifolii]